MKTLQPAREVLSVFPAEKKTEIFAGQVRANRGLVVTLVGVFFIVMLLGLLLNVIQRAVDGGRVSVGIDEAVAYQPGQVVTTELSRGYLLQTK